MAHHKLILDADFEEPYTLIAIHCSEEPYKMAYLLNQNLTLKLKRKRADIDFSANGMLATYPLYDFENTKSFSRFYLVANKFSEVTTGLKSSGNLFAEMASEEITMHNLLPEFKKVDYFLKIYSDFETVPLQKLLSQLNGIEQIISAYSLEIETIKAKNNLIFD